MSDPKRTRDIDHLLAIMARLRDPERGCPWDVAQTFATVAPYTIEEAYEVADAIDRNDMGDLRDELGDLLFSVVNVARHLRVDPELALRAAAAKFRARFEAVEALARERSIDLHSGDLDVLDALWDEIKRTPAS